MAAAEDDMTVSSRQVENMARRIAQLDYDLAAALERADRSDELMRRAESARSAAEERASDLENLMTDMAKTFDDERDRMRRDRSLWAAANNRERAQARREADQLADVRRQMEELRAEGRWPVSKLVDEADQLRAALNRLVETATARVKLPHAAPEGHGAYKEWCAVKDALIDAIEAGRAALAGVQAKEQKPWDQDDYAEARS